MLLAGTGGNEFGCASVQEEVHQRNNFTYPVGPAVTLGTARGTCLHRPVVLMNNIMGETSNPRQSHSIGRRHKVGSCFHCLPFKTLKKFCSACCQTWWKIPHPHLVHLVFSRLLVLHLLLSLRHGSQISHTTPHYQKIDLHPHLPTNCQWRAVTTRPVA